ncbi:MAG: enoyl-CoA hydratase/isomerase family protein [Anaerolineae bacterium]|nr:enoyl-CoA hydratase/isomerase family protein [Anaerolineae bacterium]
MYQKQAEFPIGILTFNRPERLNALDSEAMTLFASQIRALQNEPLAALIITGAGDKAFCSGGDLADLAARRSAADAESMIALMGDALIALENLPYPVIAAINGYALGGGSEISLACDLRILDANARLGFVQAKRGLTPGWGAGQRLMRLVGYSRALDLLLNATILSAADAQSLGLANRLAPAGEALPAALEYAAQIAALDPAVIRSLKTLLRAGLTLPYEQALQTERQLFPPLWVGAAHQRSLDEFLNR